MIVMMMTISMTITTTTRSNFRLISQVSCILHYDLIIISCKYTAIHAAVPDAADVTIEMRKPVVVVVAVIVVAIITAIDSLPVVR